MSSKQLAAGTLGCVLLAWTQFIVMAEILPPDELVTAIFGCAVFAILTRLGLGGGPALSRSNASKIVCVTMVAAGFFLGMMLGLFPAFAHNATVGFFAIAVGLALGAVLSIDRPRRAIATFLAAGTAAILVLHGFGIMTAATVMGAHLIVALSLVLFHAGDKRDPSDQVPFRSRSGLFLFRSMDAVLANVLLFPDAAAQYLIAWFFAMTCTCLLAELNQSLGSHLSRIWENSSRGAFIGVAARTNLGFLLIGGGGMMFVYSGAQTVLDHLNADAAQIRAIMVWLFLSHCGPVLMGASDLFMDITGMRSQQIWVLSFWAPMALAFIFVLAPNDPVDLAMLVAGLHLGYSAHSALVLGLQRGIWPGITALLQKNLKLT